MEDELEITESISGVVMYRLNNHFHREDGPAVEYSNGTKEYWLHGKRHRLDGPAIEWHPQTDDLDQSIYYDWFFQDELIDCKNQEEFERIIKLRVFI